MHQELPRMAPDGSSTRRHGHVLRTKSVGTKVTEQEFAAFEVLAGGQRLSEWVRHTLLNATAPDPSASAILSELLALRTILLNLHFTVCRGETVTQDTMQRLIERADSEKHEKARDRLAPPFARGTR